MKVIQVNTSVNSGSTGRLAEAIGIQLINSGYKSYIAAAYTSVPSKNSVIKIGNKLDRGIHLLKSRILDKHGHGSLIPTKNLISTIKKIEPSVFHLHNVHGYYLHIETFFRYLVGTGKPIIWTFHDCWPFTGHCSYFDAVDCFKWRNECKGCPNLTGYPKSYFYDNSKRNFYEKKRLFTAIHKMILVSPSIWLSEHLKNSYLQQYEVKVINNGIDLTVFKPVTNQSVLLKYNLKRKYILGVASIWSKRKGFLDFLQLRNLLSPGIDIVLVGLPQKMHEGLPYGILGISRTENIEDLASLYSGAEAFVNPTYVDNFPTTNLESLACGTPVITYNTGGSPETIDCKTGYVVPKGDIEKLASVINEVIDNGKQKYLLDCRNRAANLYDKSARFADYLSLYKKIIREY